MSEASLPFSLDIISDYTETFTPPDGIFDPSGDWEQDYVQWIALRGDFGKSWKAGEMRIRRFRDRGTRLAVDQTIATRDPNRSARVRAIISCADDTLSTPTGWSVVSCILDKEGSPVDYTETRVSGSFRDENICLFGDAERKIRTAKAVTSNWTLFDAVQRLPFESRPLEFDMLEDLELLKPDQRLAYRGSVELTLGGRRVRLHSFEQIGRGILPYTYWLDEQHRLMFAVGGLRTFLLNSAVGQEARA